MRTWAAITRRKKVIFHAFFRPYHHTFPDSSIGLFDLFQTMDHWVCIKPTRDAQKDQIQDVYNLAMQMSQPLAVVGVAWASAKLHGLDQSTVQRQQEFSEAYCSPVNHRRGRGWGEQAI